MATADNSWITAKGCIRSIGGCGLFAGNTHATSVGCASFPGAAFYFGVRQDLKDGRPPRVRLRDEYGGEVFYNVAVTSWFLVTADLQVVSPAL